MNFLNFLCVREGGGVQRSEIDPRHVVCWGSVECCVVVTLLLGTCFHPPDSVFPALSPVLIGSMLVVHILPM